MHTAVLVIMDKEIPEDQLYFELQEVLAPYDENLEVPMYRKFTRAELIASERKYEQLLLDTMRKEYADDPEKFIHAYQPGYLARLEQRTHSSDEAVWQRGSEVYEENELDAEGNVYSTENPQGKFDYFLRGGRYQHSILNSDGLYDKTGNLAIKGCDTLRKKDLTALSSPGAVVDKGGVWHDASTISGLDLLDQPVRGTDEYVDFQGFIEAAISGVIQEADPEDWLLVVEIHS